MSKTILIVMLLMIVVVVWNGNNNGIFDSKPALKIVVSTDLDKDNIVKVTNVTFEQTTVPFFYARRDSPAQFPEINTYIKYNLLNTEPASYWVSAQKIEDNATYIFTLTFREGKEPNFNDTLILPIKITDFRGRTESKKTAFYEWK